MVRTYPDYKLANGNCWIGRPLILGDYYVKELTRSEGYELSIGNRMQQQTNLGQDVNAGVPGDLTGYAGIVGILTAEEQISDEPTGDVEDPDYNQLFLQLKVKKQGIRDLILYSEICRRDQNFTGRTVFLRRKR